MYDYRKLSPEARAELIDHRARCGYPLHAPPHPRAEQGWFLITAATYEHRHWFSQPDERQSLLMELRRELTAGEIVCSAWVVLPNHYHLLVEIPTLERLSEPLRRVHARTAREINQRDGRQGRQIWYRFTDRRIRSIGHLYTTLNYIHYNPVKHGYTPEPVQWSASSVHWYLEHWGAEALETLWSEYPLRAYGAGWDV